MPTISTLTIDTQVKTSRLSQGLKMAGTAILAVGAIATKMALDYDDAFTKIAAVSNASAADVEKWKGQVLDLAGKTAQAPKELADALYFLASAGLKANQIMPVLEASAKASAVGLGETADIAHLTANVLNAYAGSGLKAAQVTDTLVAAVKAGSADTDEFGTAIGRILPIAATAGVGFDSIAASLASLSNVGIDVNEGVTAMRGLMQALVSPTSAAADQMEAIGLSSQDLLDSLREDGLIATLRVLEEAVRKGSATDADYMANLRAIIPNVRALTGMLGLTAQEAKGVDALFQQVSKSTGELDTAFKTTAESAGFKFRQALAELSVVAIRLGDLILPVLATIVSFLMDNLGPAWDATVEWLKKVWEQVGPVATIIGKNLIEAVTQIWHVIQADWLPSLKRLWESLQPLIKAIGVLAGAILIVALEVLPVLFKWWGLQLQAFSRGVEVVSNVVGAIIRFFQRLWDFLRPIFDFIGDRWQEIWIAMKVIVGVVVGPIIAFIDRIIGVIKTLIGWIQTAVEWLGKLDIGSDVTTLAPGGPRRAGGLQHGGEVLTTGMALVHKGEVFSGVNNEMGFGGGIHITINGDVTGEEVVRKVRDGLLKLKARNATTGL